MSDGKGVGIGLLGLGVIGTGVAASQLDKADALAQQAGFPLTLKRVLVRDPSKKRSLQLSPDLITTDAQSILNDPDIDIIIELIGGETPAVEYARDALSKGKHVVTANKEVIAKHGLELTRLAAQNNTGLRYEASVGGGIPIVSPFVHDLLANRITAIHAIINGTTNYIVTKMATDDVDFDTALAQAQELGYAEPDPANDVEGIDAAYKIAILATLAFRTEVRPEHIYYEGISRLAARDFRYASELGYAIKLLAIAKEEHNLVQARVHPAFIPHHLLLAKVDGVFNAIQVEGDLTGRVIFYGQGAGSHPTTSAIVADTLRLAQDIGLGLRPRPQPHISQATRISPMSEIRTRYYMRMTIPDHPGVLAQIAKVLGDHSISIASVIQKEADENAQTAEIVIMTHLAKESAVQQAIAEIRNPAGQPPIAQEIGNLIRVED